MVCSLANAGCKVEFLVQTRIWTTWSLPSSQLGSYRYKFPDLRAMGRLGLAGGGISSRVEWASSQSAGFWERVQTYGQGY